MSAQATVLIVDDEEVLRKALMFQFKKAGFNTLCACNGNEAYKIINETHVDIVVSDIQMPDGDGIDLLDKIRKTDAELPVLVFISAFSDLSDEEAYHLGANAIFPKPFDRHQLLETVRNLVSTKGRSWKNIDPASVSVEGELKISEDQVTLGRGGAFVSLIPSQELRPGQNFNVVLSKHGFTIEGQMRVKWIRHEERNNLLAGFGLEFVCLNQKSIQNLETWLAGHPMRHYIPMGEGFIKSKCG